MNLQVKYGRTLASQRTLGSMEMCEDYLEAASLGEDTCKWKYGNV